ncbi:MULTISPECIES: hypothetical protein [unclassified Pseudoalteromonas]|uniref:hypothetical protein n=1 Tax=unclassified Pseudoalteromonas TaxID=194690 RepID=UPI0030147D4E
MNLYLLVAGILTLIAALLHIGCIYFGASWYRFFGAGEHMARLAEQGSHYPTLVTSVITLVLLIWSAYAAAGAGVLLKLPFMRWVLSLITLLLLLRAVAGFYFVFEPMGRTPAFWLWSSLICLLLAALYGVGLVQKWPILAKAK